MQFSKKERSRLDWIYVNGDRDYWRTGQKYVYIVKSWRHTAASRACKSDSSLCRRRSLRSAAASASEDSCRFLRSVSSDISVSCTHRHHVSDATHSSPCHFIRHVQLHRYIHVCTTPPHHNRFTALFPRPPGWAGATRELLDFMVQAKINRGRHTDHRALGATPSWLTSAHHHHPPVFTGRMPFLPPNQQCQSTEGN